MKFGEAFWFNPASYQTAMANKELSDKMLKKKIVAKRKKKLANKTAIWAYSIITPITFGATAPALVAVTRNHSVRKRKVKVLEKMWEERNKKPVPHPKSKMLKSVLKKLVTGLVDLGCGNDVMDEDYDSDASSIKSDMDAAKSVAERLEGKSGSENESQEETTKKKQKKKKKRSNKAEKESNVNEKAEEVSGEIVEVKK